METFIYLAILYACVVYMLAYIGYRLGVPLLRGFEHERITFLLLPLAPILGQVWSAMIVYLVIKQLLIRASNVRIF